MTPTCRLAIPWGDGVLDVPDDPFRLEVAAAAPPASRGPDRPVLAALARPVGSPAAPEVFRGASSVLVVVSDGTRRTGAAECLPALLEAIREGSPAARVAFAVACGIHRKPTADEADALLGPTVAGRFPVGIHDPDEAGRHVDLGSTRYGTPVRLNAEVVRHDRLVLTGAVGFHYFAGFSGGRKSLVPGLASRETIARNHLRALRPDGTRHPLARAGRLDGNPVHRDMVEGAALARPHFLMNVVIAEDGRIERAFAGHWRRAHEAACRHVRATRTVRLEPRDLVVVSAGGEPTDGDLIQSHKSFEAAFGALRPGGVMVLAARCREGAGHPDFLRFLDLGGEEAMAAALRREYRVYGQTALSWVRKARSCRLILVSGLDGGTCSRARAERAGDVEEALRLARESLPAGTRGWVFPRGGTVLVEPAGAR